MEFDKVLNEIKSIYTIFQQEKQRTDAREREFTTRVREVASETIEQEIRTKIGDVYRETRRAFDRLVSMEEYLKKDNLRRAFSAAKPNYNKAEFLVELKACYDRFSSFLNRYCVKGAESPADVVNGLAQAYRNVDAINADTETLLQKQVREKEVKDKAIAEIHAEESRYLKQRESETAVIRQDIVNRIRDLKAGIKEYADSIDSETVFGPEPVVDSDFSESPSIIVGRAHLPSVQRESFPEFNETVALPDTVIERVPLATTGTNANILIRYTRGRDDEDPEGLYKVVESLIVRFVQCYPAYFKSICAIHESTGSDLISIMGEMCYNKNYKLLLTGKAPTVESEQDGIRNAINALSQKLAERMELLAGEANLISFNSSNSDNAEDLILLVIKDYPDGFDESSRRKLQQLLRNANKFGIYLLLIVPDKKDETLDKLCNLCSNVYTYRSGALIAKNGSSIEPALGSENFNTAYFSKMFQIFDSFKRVIHFKDIMSENYREEDFSSLIEIPIGKEDTSVVSLRLGTRNDPPHCVISGTTNSGKSSLLQNIVLGGATRYSPKELEFWLMDFKDGAGFSNYERLDHVTMMALKNKQRDASELLHYLHDEMRRRNSLVASVQNIDAYNQKQRAAGKPLLTRLIVIIDEYTQMSKMHECVEILKDIAQQGRSAGISLVMCSQVVDSAFDDTVTQADHRFEFANNKLGRLIDVRDEGQMAKFLSTLKGNVLYSNAGYNGTSHRMRVAYAGNVEEQLRLIEEIDRKHAAVGRQKPLVLMGKPDVPVRPASSCKAEGSELEMVAAANGKKIGVAVNVPVGETRLGKIVQYKINSANPLLFLFGDETRLASVEFTLLKRFSALSEGTNTYYVDTMRSADRKNNVMLEWARKGDKRVRFARNISEFSAVLDDLKAEYERRQKLLDDDKDVGESIELVIHAADNLLEQLRTMKRADRSAEKSRPDLFADVDQESIMRDDTMSDEEIDAIMSSHFSTQNEDDTPENTEKTDYPTLFRTLFTKGKEVRIFTMLQFTDMSKFRDRKQDLFGEEPNLKDVIIIPQRPEEGESSVAQIVDCLNAAKQEDFAAMYSNGDSDAGELEYAIVIDEFKPTKILPYEWSVERR